MSEHDVKATQAIPVVIYGSCVTRDMFEFAPPSSSRVIDYIARQSWCSIGSVAQPTSLTSLRLESPFQTRSLQGDLRGDALSRIRQALSSNPEACLLIDLTDDRAGIYRGPDGVVLTRNLDVAGTGVYETLGEDWERLPFGFLGYSLHFGEAAAMLRASLEDLGIWERTMVIGNLWAREDTDGQQIYSSSLDADAMNPLLVECYDFLEDQGWNVLRLDEIVPLADANHRWGASPFHYDLSYYREMSRRVQAFLRPTGA